MGAKLVKPPVDSSKGKFKACTKDSDCHGDNTYMSVTSATSADKDRCCMYTRLIARDPYYIFGFS